MKQLLKNATIYDGTGSEPFQADILLEGDRIAKIAPQIPDSAAEEYDASGKYVKYLKSEKDLRQYIPDFKERVEAFYTKYGK